MIHINDVNIKSEIVFISCNQTIYISNVNKEEIAVLPDLLINLLDNHTFKKIIVKIPLVYENEFINKGFYREAYIPNFYKNGEGCSYVSYIDNLSTFINGEYRYIKNRLLELMEISITEKVIDENLSLKEITIDKTTLNTLLDKLTYPVIDDLRKHSNNKFFDDCIKIIGNAEDSKINPLMIFYLQDNSDKLEILEISPKDYSTITALLHYCEEYSRNNNIRIIHMLSDIENPIQNFALKEKFFRYGGTLISKIQDGKPKRNFNVWFKTINGE